MPFKTLKRKREYQAKWYREKRDNDEEFKESENRRRRHQEAANWPPLLPSIHRSYLALELSVVKFIALQHPAFIFELNGKRRREYW